MALPTSLLSAMVAVEETVFAANSFRDTSENAAGLLGYARIRLIGDEVSTEMPVREANLSSHAEIVRHVLITKVESSLRAFVQELCALLPGRDLTYMYQTSSKKHTLHVGTLEVIDAVQGSFRAQLPKILKLFALREPEDLWLLSPNTQPGGTLYRASEMVSAPSLASAHVRYRFASMTQTERRNRKFDPYHKTFAAARLFPADTMRVPDAKNFDADRLRSAWEAFLVEIKGEKLLKTCEANVKVAVSTEAGLSRTCILTCHPLTHPSDKRNMQAIADKVVAASEDFAQELASIAPHTSFAVEAPLLHGMNARPKVRLGRQDFHDATWIVDEISKIEASAHAEKSTHAVRCDDKVFLIEASTAEEAINQVNGQYSIQVFSSVQVFRCEPVLASDVELAMSTVAEEWEATW